MTTRRATRRPACRSIATQQCPAPGVCVLHLRGRLDLATSPEMGEVLQAALARAQRLLVLDLAAVTFMDSTAVGHVLRAIRQLAPGARLALCRIPARLRMLLEIAGIVEPVGEGSGGLGPRRSVSDIGPCPTPGVRVGAALAGRVALFRDVPAAMSSSIT